MNSKLEMCSGQPPCCETNKRLPIIHVQNTGVQCFISSACIGRSMCSVQSLPKHIVRAKVAGYSLTIVVYINYIENCKQFVFKMNEYI